MVKQAGPSDIPVIEGILLDAVKWMAENELSNQWNETNIMWYNLSKSYQIEDFYIVYHDIDYLDQGPAACMAITDYDPTYWPDIPKGESIYIHKMAVKRTFAGKGFSRELIKYAKGLAKGRSTSTIRLNCNGYRSKLRKLYENEGFICVEEKVFSQGYNTALYVCHLPE